MSQPSDKAMALADEWMDANEGRTWRGDSLRVQQRDSLAVAFDAARREALALAREYVEAKDAASFPMLGDNMKLLYDRRAAAYNALAQAVGKRGNDEPTK